MTEDSSLAHLIVHREGSILSLRLNQPDSFNALTEPMLVSLVEQLRLADCFGILWVNLNGVGKV